MLLSEALTDRVIGLAIEVHRHTGPGLLELVYEQRLCRELGNAQPIGSTIFAIKAIKTFSVVLGLRRVKSFAAGCTAIA